MQKHEIVAELRAIEAMATGAQMRVQRLLERMGEEPLQIPCWTGCGRLVNWSQSAVRCSLCAKEEAV